MDGGHAQYIHTSRLDAVIDDVPSDLQDHIFAGESSLEETPHNYAKLPRKHFAVRSVDDVSVISLILGFLISILALLGCSLPWVALLAGPLWLGGAWPF